MATTTNYSWTTPDDTALVKDGAAAIRSLGTAIDTTVFTNAGNAIAKTIVDAKGDLIVATAADTVARLAVGGTNGQVLQVDSSTASGLKWDTVSAGGMTSIASGSLSSFSITLSSIPATYNNLQLVIRDYFTSGASEELCLRVNGNNTASAYYIQQVTSNATSFTNTSQNYLYVNLATSTDRNTSTIVNLWDYTSSMNKNGSIIFNGAAGSASFNGAGHFFISETTALNSITIFSYGGSTMSGSYILYGVK
jgi:hypothetical protein